MIYECLLFITQINVRLHMKLPKCTYYKKKRLHVRKLIMSFLGVIQLFIYLSRNELKVFQLLSFRFFFSFIFKKKLLLGFTDSEYDSNYYNDFVLVKKR